MTSYLAATRSPVLDSRMMRTFFCSSRARPLFKTKFFVFAFFLLLSISLFGFPARKSIFQSSSTEETVLNIIVVGHNEETFGLRVNNNNTRYTPSTIALDNNQIGCRVPQLEINGEDVIKFYEEPSPLNCDKNEENWAFVDDERRFRFSETIQKKVGEIKCELSYLTRIDDETVREEESIPISEGDELTGGDFAQVTCRQGGFSLFGKSWSHLLWTISPRSERIEQLSSIVRNDDWSGLNVYFIGFDSLSQMAFRRNLPRTVKFLEEELEAVILNGYNIVGDGTPQALIPILTAQTEEELPLTRKRFANAHFLDDVYPFIWKNFSDLGYITMFAEDMAKLGTFNYRLKGFKTQPTDHYTRPFFMKAEHFYSDVNCLGSLPMHKEWFRYASEFMIRYNASLPKFLFAFHGMLSHDHVTRVKLADADVEGNLRFLNEKGIFSNSVVIVMADHGHRFAKFRETHQGQMEERLPFFSIALPKGFRESPKGRLAWENLKKNKHRLSTPFDVHATLMDILHWPNEALLRTPNDVARRSLSLFREIPLSRTCSQAGIPAHFCTCLKWKSALGSSEEVALSIRLARSVVQSINSYTRSERALCSPIVLSQVEDSQALVPEEGVLKYRGVKDADGFVADLEGNVRATHAYYQLRLYTRPGNALYEATVKYEATINTVTVDFTSISHVNKYGDLPHCVIDKNYFLAAYCVCYDKIETNFTFERQSQNIPYTIYRISW